MELQHLETRLCYQRADSEVKEWISALYDQSPEIARKLASTASKLFGDRGKNYLHGAMDVMHLMSDQ